MPPAQKKPMDHLKKGELNSEDRTFSFEHKGEKFTSPPLHEVLSPKWFRHNRKVDGLDAAFTMLEAIFSGDDEAMAAVDDMSWAEVNSLFESLNEAMGATMGESSGSST